jgi:hypothetical protein
MTIEWTEIGEEEPYSELDANAYINWLNIPENKRNKCLVFLRQMIPTILIDKWADQWKRGKCIGSDNIRFHFSVGMDVRNALREVMRDEELPGIEYLDGHFYQNWDDFYMGALEALVKE